MAREGYISPPPKEYPAKYTGKMSGNRKLTDEIVIECRKLAATSSINKLSKTYAVSYKTMWDAVKGLSFKHLNIDHPPQF